MGLPAEAVSGAHSEAAAAKVTPAIAGPVSPAVAAPSALLALPAALTGGAPVSAPAAAKVSFERPAFAAVPKPAARPSALGGGSSSSTFSIASFASAKGSSVIALAQRYLGVPYVFGGSSPGGWDCSGANVYIFGLLGISLPRTSNEQMLATTRIPRSQARAGDLVFFLSGGRAYHTGIFDGSGGVYDSGRSGEVYQHRAIWSSNVVFTRVTG
jgi:cell wall-associated NlpC family hydrolase